MNAKSLYNLLITQRPETNLDKILGQKLLKGLVRPMSEFVKSVTKTNNKLHNPKTYNEIINNHVYENR